MRTRLLARPRLLVVAAAAAIVIVAAAILLAGGGGDGGSNEDKATDSNGDLVDRGKIGGVKEPPKKVAPKVSGAVQVTAYDNRFEPRTVEASAGEVTITLTNKGNIPHRIGVMETGREASELPVTRDQVDEDLIIADVAAVFPGDSANLTVSLQAGRYVLVDNLPGHYEDGVYGTLVVR